MSESKLQFYKTYAIGQAHELTDIQVKYDEASVPSIQNKEIGVKSFALNQEQIKHPIKWEYIRHVSNNILFLRKISVSHNDNIEDVGRVIINGIHNPNKVCSERNLNCYVCGLWSHGSYWMFQDAVRVKRKNIEVAWKNNETKNKTIENVLPSSENLNAVINLEQVENQGSQRLIHDELYPLNTTQIR